MEIKRFFFHEYNLKGAPAVRAIPALPPVTEEIERFLAGGIRVVGMDLDTFGSGEYPGAVLTFRYVRSESCAKHAFAAFFMRSGGSGGFAHVDDGVNAFIAEHGDPDPRFATATVGHDLQKLVVVTAVVAVSRKAD